MKLERGHLSKGECVAFVITLIATFVAVVFGPSMYLAATGQTSEGHASALPKHGTVEYEKFKKDFEDKYGREWTLQDDLDAARNGAYVMAGVITSLMAAGTLFSLVHDLRCWFNEKALYRTGASRKPPMKPGTQLIRILVYLSLALPFACFMWIVVPRILIPIP